MSASLPLFLLLASSQENRWAELFCFKGFGDSEVPLSQGISCTAGPLELSHPGPFYRCLKKLKGQDRSCSQGHIGDLQLN